MKIGPSLECALDFRKKLGMVGCCQRMGIRGFVCPARFVWIRTSHGADGRRHNCVYKLFLREQRHTLVNISIRHQEIGS